MVFGSLCWWNQLDYRDFFSSISRDFVICFSLISYHYSEKTTVFIYFCRSGTFLSLSSSYSSKTTDRMVHVRWCCWRQWGEAHRQCSRLKLVDLIVKPWQHLTKYKLLLYAMRKPLDKMEPSSDANEQRNDITAMVTNCTNANYHHHHHHHFIPVKQQTWENEQT